MFNAVYFPLGFAADVLDEASELAAHRGSTELSKDDAKLAIQTRTDLMFAPPPPREVWYFSEQYFVVWIRELVRVRRG